MRLDSADSADGAADIARFDGSMCSDVNTEHMDTVEIRIDGGTVTVAKASADAIVRLDAALAQARADLTAAQAAKAAAEAAKIEAEKRADAAVLTDAARDALVSARAGLVADAAKILGADFRADGKSDAEIRKAAVAKAYPTMRTDMSDAEVAGAFAVAVASVGAASLAAARSDAAVAPAERIDAKAVREARIRERAEAQRPGARAGKDGK